MVFRDKTITKNWSAREIVAEDGTICKFKYFYKRKEVSQIYLQSPLAKQFAGYVLIEKDIRNVIIWLQKINIIFNSLPEEKCRIAIGSDRETFDLIKGLWVAALTFYGKCFSSAEGRKIKLDSTFLDLKYHKQHAFYMQLRHNFAAHSGLDSYEGVRIALVVARLQKTKFETIIVPELYQQDYISYDTENELLILAEHIHKKVQGKIHEIHSLIYEKEVAPLMKKLLLKKNNN